MTNLPEDVPMTATHFIKRRTTNHFNIRFKDRFKEAGHVFRDHIHYRCITISHPVVHPLGKRGNIWNERSWVKICFSSFLNIIYLILLTEILLVSKSVDAILCHRRGRFEPRPMVYMANTRIVYGRPKIMLARLTKTWFSTEVNTLQFNIPPTTRPDGLVRVI